MRAAVLLSAVTNRADEYLTPTPGTQEQSGVVHRSPRRGGLDDPRSPGNTALGAVRKCGSGRSLGRGRPRLDGPGLRRPLRRARSNSNPWVASPHRRGGKAPLADTVASNTRQGWAQGQSARTIQPIQRRLGSSSAITSRPMCTVYAHFFAAINSRSSAPAPRPR